VSPTIGVLALQGDFAAHAAVLERLGASVREVRTPEGLEGLDGLVLPGGESTTMSLGIEREGLAEPLRALARAGTPILATCAGMILLDREHLGVLDMRTRRNAFGRQVRSFETELALDGIAGAPLRVVFIRAPWVEQHGRSVKAIGAVDGHTVAVAAGHVRAVAFHPELTGEARLHSWLVEQAAAERRAAA